MLHEVAVLPGMCSWHQPPCMQEHCTNSACVCTAAWQTAADSPLVSTTALRIQQGMPLVSTEKLPRWAIQASKAAGQQGPLPAVLSDGGSSGEQAQQAWKPPADSRWAQQSPVPDGSGQAGASKVGGGRLCGLGHAARYCRQPTACHCMYWLPSVWHMS